MEAPIFIHYCFSADDMVEARRYTFRHGCRPLFRVGLHFFMGMMLLAGLLGVGAALDLLPKPANKPRIEPGWLTTSVAFMVVGVYWFLIRPFIWKRIIRREFSKRNDRDIELEWLILPERLALKSRLGSSEFSWEAVLKVVQTPAGFLLYIQANFAHWLPQRGFASELDFERFAQLAQEHAPQFFRIT